MIFEDTNGDGVADKCIHFADDLNCPTGFQIYKDGILLMQAPDLWYLRDTNGDGKADWKERVLMGMDSADSHHTANSLVLDPGGAIYLSDGVFHRTQVESINGPEQAARELADIRAELSEETGTFSELFMPGLRKALLIGLLIMVFSQINGVNMMLLFGPSILQEAGIGDASQSIFFTIFLNLVILVSTMVAFWLVDRFGRRPIMIWGVAAMAVGHLMMAANFYFGGSPYINLLAMFVAAGAFTLSLAPLSWVIVSEIFPNQVRAKALSIVCVMLYLSSFLCAQFFPMITEAFQKAAGHPGGAYLIFAGICGACVLFCWKLLPETKDLTLEDIGRFWLKQKKIP